MSEQLNKKPRLLLHICCGTCSIYPFLCLKKDFDVTFFYYNPNIYPEEEYLRRLDDVKTISKIYSIPLIIDNYEIKKWMKLTSDFKNEPEGGKRCDICFKVRLEKTAITAKKLRYDIFCTTLTVSPHKNQKIINSLGAEIAASRKIDFYQADFKKKDGFKKTMELSKKLNLYHQNYCGCIYSMR
jgi:predicted adenine nucleotide alpha hydrolase (AANH) superfamily ATPase